MNPETLQKDPFQQFLLWYEEARTSKEPQADAVTLATANAKGQPSARMILYKGIQKGRFALYTNFLSRKARELETNPQAALVFHWPTLKKQIRIEGTVKKMTYEEGNAYFQSRPREYQLGTLCSQQSEVIASRQILEERYQELAREYQDRSIPCPEWWGGFWLTPHQFEFWMEGERRLHDRLQYRLKNHQWLLERLSP